MNVLHVVPSLDGRSWTRDLDILSRRLPTADMRIFCLGEVGPASASLSKSGVSLEVRQSRRVLDPSLLWRLRSLLRGEPPTVVHAWGMASVRAIATARFRSLQQTIVSAPLPPRPRDLPMLDRWLLRQTSVVLARTHAEADALRSVGVSAAAIRVTPPGIESVPVQAPAPSHEPVIQCIGRLEPHKGFRDTIWSQDMLLQVFPAIRVRIAGDGNSREDLRRFATAMHNSNVDLLGEVVNPESQAAQGNFGFALSLGGFGCRSVLELMAAALPVIASDMPHHRELIADGENGYLTPFGEKIGPARRIRALLHDPQTAERTGAAARRHVSDHFSAEAFAERMAAIYAEPSSRGVR